MRLPALGLATLLASLTLTACDTTPREPEFNKDDSEMIKGRLRPVTNAQAALVFLDPNADFADFNQIIIDPLDLSSVDIIQPGTSGITARRGKWELDERNREMLQAAYMEVFTNTLTSTGDFEVVTAPGPGVMRISAAVTAIAPSATMDNSRSRNMGRSRVYTEGAGSMAVGFVLSDSENGEVFAIVKDQRSGSPVWGVNNAVSNMGDVRFMFGRWARMLRARMDIAHGY